MRARYDVVGKHTTLFGSSLGGLFVVHAALNARGSFDNFIAVSPALWWNEEGIFGVGLKRAQATGNVFITVGGREEDLAIPGLAPFKMVTNAQRLAAEMTESVGAALRVHFEAIPEETHTSVVPVGLTRGLRWIARAAVPQ